ncbi:MAG: hypothetical protein ACTSR1_09165, partial [Candidatus Heimdallarchaeota archaeon]
HGMSVGLFTPQSVAWQAKVTERWKDLCPLFGLDISGMPRKKALDALLQEMQLFIRKVDGFASVSEFKSPEIHEEDYKKAIPLMAKFALNDIAHLASYRPLKVKDYIRLYEAAWDSEKLVF